MTQATKIWYAVTIQDYSMDVEDEMPCIHRVRHTEIAWTTKELTDSDLFEDCYVLGCPDHHDVGRLYLEKNEKCLSTMDSILCPHQLISSASRSWRLAAWNKN